MQSKQRSPLSPPHEQSFKESEYGAMYAISSLLALFLHDGTSDFTEDAKLRAAKMEVFQRDLFALVKDFTELIIEHTKDTKDTWAKLFHAQYLAASSGIHDIPDLNSPATPVSIGLGFRHRDLHLGGRAYCMLVNECAQHTANNGSRAIA